MHDRAGPARELMDGVVCARGRVLDFFGLVSEFLSRFRFISHTEESLLDHLRGIRAEATRLGHRSRHTA